MLVCCIVCLFFLVGGMAKEYQMSEKCPGVIEAVSETIENATLIELEQSRRLFSARFPFTESRSASLKFQSCMLLVRL